MKQIIFTLFTFVWLPCAFFEVAEKPTIDIDQTSVPADPEDSKQAVSQETPESAVVTKANSGNPKKPGKITTTKKPKKNQKKKPGKVTTAIKAKSGNKQKPKEATTAIKAKSGNKQKPKEATTVVKAKSGNKQKPKEVTTVVKAKSGNKQKPKEITTVVKAKSGNKQKTKQATTVKNPNKDNLSKPEQVTTVIEPEEDNLPKSEPENVVKPRSGIRQKPAVRQATVPVNTTVIKPNKNNILPKSGPATLPVNATVIKPNKNNILPKSGITIVPVNTTVIKPNKNNILPKSGPVTVPVNTTVVKPNKNNILPKSGPVTVPVNTTVVKPNKNNIPPKSGPAIVIKPKSSNVQKPQQATVPVNSKKLSYFTIVKQENTTKLVQTNSTSTSITKSQGGKRKRTKADGTLNIPQHTQIPLYCANCDHCVDTPPRIEHIQRRDASGKSYCYTKQFMDKGLLTIKRGSIRPDPSHWDGNLHAHCPFKSFQIRAKDQWCFCKTNDCNENRMEFDGIVKSEFSSKTKSK